MIDEGFQVTAVEGVPTFVAPGPGPTTVGLVFRVGVADETLPTHGLTHLVAHLALSDVTSGEVHAHGTTGLDLTTCHARGDDDELVAFFAAVGSALRQLPLDRLDRERASVQAEAARRPRAIEGELLNWRFGPDAWGLVDWPELGVEHVGPEAVQHWARERFVQGNAALWVQGRLPPALRLGLPPGSSWPVPPVTPLDDPLPAVSTHELANVTISLLVPRSPAAPIALAMLAGRCRQRLRADEGSRAELTWTDTTMGDRCLLTLGADCLPDEAAAVLDRVLAELGVLATLGPDPAEVQAARREMVRAAGEATFRDWSVVAAAHASVRGEPSATPRELLDRRVAVTAEEIRRVLDLGRDTAQLLVPPGVSPRDRRYQPTRLTSSTPVAGRSVRRARASADPSADHVLTVGPDGVSIAFDEHHHGVVRWSTCAAVEQFSDGARVLVGADRLELVVHPEEWEQGHQVIALIDRATPDDRRVPMDRPLGSSYLADLDRAVAGGPGPSRASDGHGRGRRRR